VKVPDLIGLIKSGDKWSNNTNEVGDNYGSFIPTSSMDERKQISEKENG